MNPESCTSRQDATTALTGFLTQVKWLDQLPRANSAAPTVPFDLFSFYRRGPQRFCHEECGDAGSEAFENNSNCVTSSVHNSPVEDKDPVSDSAILLVSQPEPGPEGVERSCIATLPGFALPTPPTLNLPAEATLNIPSVKAMVPAGKHRTRKLWTADEEARFTKALDKLAPVEESVIASDVTSGRISVRLPSGVTELLAAIVGTRTTIQVRSHVQRYYLRKIREMGPGWKCKAR